MHADVIVGTVDARFVWEIHGAHLRAASPEFRCLARASFAAASREYLRTVFRSTPVASATAPTMDLFAGALPFLIRPFSSRTVPTGEPSPVGTADAALCC